MAVLQSCDTRGVRIAVVSLALCGVVACGATERVPTTAPKGTGVQPPGLRLPDNVTPLAYDLKLDVDPDSEQFRGEVTIEVRIERATDHVWLHSDQLGITEATWTDGTLTPVDVQGEQMKAYRFGRVVEAGTTTKLHFTYSGLATGDQEGLFRQRGGAWYMFTQGEAVFTRRITPCFDEPRWKTPWRVTLVVPRRQVALANMPETLTTVIDGGKKEVAFAESPPMPSYLLAFAIGPFDLVDAGTVGRNKVPVRVVVRAGEGKRAGVVALRLPAVVKAIEDYLDDALPLTKLDIVGVPSFFGAMENPGLITFHEPILLGNPKRDAFADYFTYIAAHELVHQWFGNSVTPAWWDHLWLSEAFASWLGDKVTREQDAYDDTVLRVALARREAIGTGGETDSKPLLRHVTTTVDADEGFDAIAYAKGQLVLSTFEAFIGPDEFKSRVRTYVKSRRGRSVTSDDLFPTIAIGEQGEAFKSFVASRGTPVVHFELRCQGRPELIAHAAMRVPVCVSFGTGKTTGRTCTLVGASTSISVGDTCPSWVLGNPDGSYYHVGWRTQGPRGPAPPRASMAPLARIIAGDDLAAAVDRGELAAADALAQLRDLADPTDVYAQLGAVVLARTIDTLVDDATRPAWTQWLATQFADRLVADKKAAPADGELSRLLVNVVPADQFANAITRRAHDVIEKVIPAAQGELPAHLVALAGVHGGDKLFDRIVARAAVLRDPDVRDTWIESLGELGVAQVPKAVALVVDSDLSPETTWLAVARFFARPETRTAAWRAVKAALPAIKRRVSTAERHQLMLSVGHMCDATSRGEVATAFAGDKDLTTALQAIDRCIGRRAKLGDLASALATSK